MKTKGKEYPVFETIELPKKEGNLHLSAEQLTRIASNVKIDDRQFELFKAELERALETVEWWRDIRGLDHREFRDRLGQMAKHLRRAAGSLGSQDFPLRAELGHVIARRLFKYLPTALIEKLDHRTRLARPSKRNPWPTGFYGTRDEVWRRSYLYDWGAYTMGVLLESFAQEFERQLAFEKVNAPTGGSRGQPERNRLVHLLADVWEGVLKRRATPTFDGPFFKFVNAVFQELKWDKGVKMRVERCLRERKQAKGG
jgi:hypothetical protein